MNTKFFFALIFSACLITSTSCNNDDEDTTICDAPQHPTPSYTYLTFPSEKKKCISKLWVDNYTSEVYIRNKRERERHRTIRIMNLDETIIQEWLLDDLHISSIVPYKKFEYGNTGDTLYFYSWNSCGNDLLNTDQWDRVIFKYKQDKTPIKGFHIPTMDDLQKLNSLFNSCNTLINILELHQYRDYINYPYYNHDTVITTQIYVDFNNIGHPEVGTTAFWPNSNDTPESMNLVLSNMPEQHALVRLVRNLTIDEWYED